VLFRNDDISAKSDPLFEYQVLEVFRKYKIKPLFAVIPVGYGKNLNTNVPIIEALKLWYRNGWIDIAMHGYTHEFQFSKLDYDEQYDRIKAGKTVLQDALDMPIKIFCPPWNAANRQTLLALRANNINIFCGYLGEVPVEGVAYLNCNCNLIEGPLGILKEKIDSIGGTDNDILLVALYHTNYDFKNYGLGQLDSLLYDITTHKGVVVKSFSEFLGDQGYRDLLKLVNEAGYRLQYLQRNKYILKLPLFSNYFKKGIRKAEQHYWIGNYSEVICIYNSIMTWVWILIFSSLLLGFSLIIVLKRRKHGKITISLCK
jgi:peptidoglycan/xylan/chitin deacetylase (PgdA/CDA1 family)